MYNRYIPTEDGSYRRQRVDASTPYVPETPQPVVQPALPVAAAPDPHPVKPPEPQNRVDTDELLLVVILLLLLLDDQDEDMIILIAALAFLIL